MLSDRQLDYTTSPSKLQRRQTLQEDEEIDAQDDGNGPFPTDDLFRDIEVLVGALLGLVWYGRVAADRRRSGRGPE